MIGERAVWERRFLRARRVCENPAKAALGKGFKGRGRKAVKAVPQRNWRVYLNMGSEA
jgi:hypothetical protein